MKIVCQEWYFIIEYSVRNNSYKWRKNKNEEIDGNSFYESDKWVAQLLMSKWMKEHEKMKKVMCRQADFLRQRHINNQLMNLNFGKIPILSKDLLP